MGTKEIEKQISKALVTAVACMHQDYYTEVLH